MSSAGVLRVDLGGGHLLDRLFVQRYIAIGFISLAAAAFPSVDVGVALAALTAGWLTSLAGHLHARRIGQVPVWIHFADLAACLGFPLIWPSVFVAASLLMLSVVCLGAALRGIALGATLALASTVGLLAVGSATDQEHGGLVVLGFAIASVMIAAAVGNLSTTEAQLRDRLNTVVDNLTAALWVHDVDLGHITFVNRPGVDLLGWSDDEWLSPGFWASHIHPEDRDAAVAAMDHSTAEGTDHEIRYRFQTAEGGWLHLHDRVSAVVGPDGKTRALQGISFDVTDRVEIERQVSLYADIVYRIDLPLLVLGLDDATELRLVAANPAAVRLVGRDLNSQIGDTLEEAFPVLAGSRLQAKLAKVVEGGQPLTVDDLLAQPPGGGEPRVITLRAFPLPGRSVGVSLQDVTDAVQASEALRRQALYDGLTGLPNRRVLDDALNRSISSSPLPGTNIALLMMDLDQFKEVNDALGHHVGDQLLHSVGERITGLLPDALVARLGGDEFAVVLTELVDESSATEVARQIRETLSEPFGFDEVRLQSNASIGIAMYPLHARDSATLTQRADVAMYMAKRSGTGVAVYAAEHDRSSVQRLALIGDLPGAVSNDQLVLHYQPCVNLRSGLPVRAEALVRWNHPELGMLGPDQFIELAELSGAIQPLTRWVIREGLRALATWKADGHQMGLALNLSVRNLYDPELVPHLLTTLDEFDLEPTDLMLELTETELMDDPSLAREVFTGLSDIGVGTSIDDFGTGYSSLTFLRDLPLHEIKVDRSFVREMHRRSDEFTIVRSMIDLGHNLGLEVVAEGIEHEDDLRLLQRLGCDLGQGFHLSTPLAVDDLLTWLRERRDEEGFASVALET